ncbi:unnamed protein product [Callosobruchus maculatus]|uniref:E3 ubiquitin-protein ligase Sina-like RING finger domain-containing protein n=1 Tax=Callosobruchus maculatus TaxID=64391 RepID=A0A653CWB3_CALMS|nr:unnamed protein product [Callosobruchus maculatus]
MTETQTPTEKNFTSSEVLQTKCGKCGLVCSVAPVSEESGVFYCGRCRPKETPNLRFEEAAKKLVFPCALGCGIQTVWGETLQHEVCCAYRKIVCPYINCNNSITLQGLRDHVNKCHYKFYLEALMCQKIDTLGTMHRLHFIEFGIFSILFFVKLERKDDIINFHYNVCLIWPQHYEQTELDKFDLRLVIEIPYLTVTSLIDNNKILDYDDRSHCVNCLYQNCDKYQHKNEFNLTNNIPLDVKGIFQKNISYTFVVYKKDTFSRTFPNSLKCPSCHAYMMDEIYFCNNGHSFCGKCMRKQSLNRKCRICGGDFLNVRNCSMERLIKRINVPCQKELFGCRFFGLVADLLVHEKSCKF